MMNLQDSFDLVEYAFNKGVSGDILMKQSPAASVQTLVDALKKIFDSNNEIQYIGSKHCKKLYETLLNKNVMQKAQDKGRYFTISAKTRDLNYAQYVSKELESEDRKDNYSSHNTHQLDVDFMVDLLLKLDFVQKELVLSLIHI